MSSESPDLEVAGVREGDVLAGRYRVDRVLGVGGMGVVVAAHHLALDTRVAIKFLLPAALGSAESIERFDREARAVARIRSEHVARVTDVGKLETGAPYMVMEYLEGADLAAWLAQRGPLPVEQAVDFILQACEALAEAHALGIIHRDLKPANLFCATGPDGATSIKVLDFGISKLTGASAPAGRLNMTKTRAVLGSPYYMSPEQMEASRGVDARSDVWSLGVILYELLSGVVPFKADVLTEVVIKVVTGALPPLRRARSDVPPGLEQVVVRCLQKDRELRFGSVGQLAMALAPFGSARARLSVERISGVMRTTGDVSRPSLSSLPLEVQPTQAMTHASWGSTGQETRGRRRPGLLLGLAALGVVAALAGATFMARAGRGGDGATASPASVGATPAAPTLPAAAPSSAPPEAPSAVPAPAPAPPPPSTPHAAAPPPTVSPASAPARPASRPASPKAAASPAGCDPPFVIDSSGHRQYKPECF